LTDSMNEITKSGWDSHPLFLKQIDIESGPGRIRTFDQAVASISLTRIYFAIFPKTGLIPI
jgi:hypothetical protein